MTVQPGWYADPAEPTTQRYWDGEGWIGSPLPVDATPPPGPVDATPPPGPVETEPPAGGEPPTGAQAPARPGELPVPPGPPPASGPPAGWGPAPVSPGGPVPPGNVISPGSIPPGASFPPGGVVPPGWGHPPYPHPMPVPRPHGLALAPFGPRLAARLIDVGIVFLLNLAVNSWFVWRYIQEITPTYREILRRSIEGNTSTEGLPQASEQASWLQLTILLIATALWFAYEVPALANSGQTLGKRLMGVKVVSLVESERLGFGQSFRRWNTLGLPTLLWYCCGIGFLLQLIDCAAPLVDRPLRQALHDKRALTVVVQVPRPPVNPATETPVDPATETRSDDRSEEKS